MSKKARGFIVCVVTIEFLVCIYIIFFGRLFGMDYCAEYCNVYSASEFLESTENAALEYKISDSLLKKITESPYDYQIIECTGKLYNSNEFEMKSVSFKKYPAVLKSGVWIVPPIEAIHVSATTCETVTVLIIVKGDKQKAEDISKEICGELWFSVRSVYSEKPYLNWGP